MKRIVVTAGLVVSIVFLSNAQDYGTALGLRLGYFNGVTVKHFVGEKAALEGILTTRWSGFNITGLYEIHNRAFDVDRLNWYYGFGGHIGFWDGRDVYWANDLDMHTVIGIDGILGIEYNFEEVPINLSADWKPAFNIVGIENDPFWVDGGALSIRYMF